MKHCIENRRLINNLCEFLTKLKDIHTKPNKSVVSFDNIAGYTSNYLDLERETANRIWLPGRKEFVATIDHIIGAHEKGDHIDRRMESPDFSFC